MNSLETSIKFTTLYGDWTQSKTMEHRIRSISLINLMISINQHTVTLHMVLNHTDDIEMNFLLLIRFIHSIPAVFFFD